MNYLVIIGLIIPFIGTTLGSFLVFFLKNSINKKLEKFLLGFASGVMIAASIWSLLIPAINSSNLGKLSFIPAALGFALGMVFLLILDVYISKSHIKNKKTNMLYFAVTMHNIPEGMAVGAGFLPFILYPSKVSLISAFILSVGIAVQNFPEGAIISLPLASSGYSKLKSFNYGMISGIVEPIFSLITILLASFVLPTLPYLMSFAAGAMIYVVVEELIPDEDNNKTHYKTFGVMLGFLIMMILDILLG